MWAIYHQQARSFLPHWAIGVGRLSRILIAGSTLHPHSQYLKTREQDGKVKQRAKPLSPPYFCLQLSSLHLCTVCNGGRGGEVEKCMCGRGRSTLAHTHIQACWISEWKWGESVTHAARLGVDYRTPGEIFLSPQTDSERGLTISKPQNKHLHFPCNT